MDLKSGIDKFGLNPEDINDLYDDKAAATGDAPWQLLFRQRMKRILFCKEYNMSGV